MKSLAAAIAFCTRIPIPVLFGAEEVGQAARWFPLVGALLGTVSVAICWEFRGHLPSPAIAALVVIAEALLTGALHMDGLADTADGFGGGKTRDDMLRIMRDHAIGSYGGSALVLMILTKAACIAALAERPAASLFLVLAPALGRWNIVLLSHWLPYARPNQAVSRHIGRRELLLATAMTGAMVCAVIYLVSWRAAAAAGMSLTGAVLFGVYCRRKIGGVTGDTLGTVEEIGECLALLAGAWN